MAQDGDLRFAHVNSEVPSRLEKMSGRSLKTTSVEFTAEIKAAVKYLRVLSLEIVCTLMTLGKFNKDMSADGKEKQ